MGIETLPIKNEILRRAGLTMNEIKILISSQLLKPAIKIKEDLE